MAKAHRPVLAHIGDGAGVHVGLPQRFQQRGLAGLLQARFQFRGFVEVILQRTLAACGHENEFLDPGGARLVDRVLDQRAVDEGHDLFRDRLRRRQEPGAEAGDREYSFRDFPFHTLSNPVAAATNHPATVLTS